jgi:hypothetical protein
MSWMLGSAIVLLLRRRFVFGAFVWYFPRLTVPVADRAVLLMYWLHFSDVDEKLLFILRPHPGCCLYLAHELLYMLCPNLLTERTDRHGGASELPPSAWRKMLAE